MALYLISPYYVTRCTLLAKIRMRSSTKVSIACLDGYYWKCYKCLHILMAKDHKLLLQLLSQLQVQAERSEAETNIHTHHEWNCRRALAITYSIDIDIKIMIFL